MMNQNRTPSKAKDNDGDGVLNSPRLSSDEEIIVDSIKSMSIVVENSLSGVYRLPSTYERPDADVNALLPRTVNLTPHVGNQEQQDEPDKRNVPLNASPCGNYLKYATMIGKGAVKTVFRGYDLQKRVPIAWCEIVRNEWRQKDRQRFRDEAHLLSYLNHPNILRCCAYWEGVTISEPSVLITDLMTHGTLRNYISTFQKVNLKVAKSWCVQILKGLNYLHTKDPPIVHRDLKCDNIFVQGSTGCIKVGDLGLATQLVNGFATSFVGTPEFMAAEMYDGYYDEKVDIYSFGMCVIEILTSEYPYSECIGINEIHKHVMNGIEPDAYFKIKDPTASSIVRSCIQMNKFQRPTCTELLGLDFFSGNSGYAERKSSRNAKFRKQRVTFASSTRSASQRMNGPSTSSTSRYGCDRNNGPSTSGVTPLPRRLLPPLPPYAQQK